jgi:hypothetical protein
VGKLCSKRYHQPDAGRILSSLAADEEEFGRQNLNFNYGRVKQLTQYESYYGKYCTVLWTSIVRSKSAEEHQTTMDKLWLVVD